MPVPDPRSRARLAAIGVQVWVRRDRSGRATVADPSVQSTAPRVRLAAGDGAWLLVQRRPWDGRHAELLADIQAAVRPGRCRFGQWADHAEAGLALSELGQRGVAHVIAFGPPPAAAECSMLILAPPLDELAVSAAARRALWQALCAHLAD